MSDIRKRTGRKGTTYQVRYRKSGGDAGYGYATFRTRKEAVAFLEGGDIRSGHGATENRPTSVCQAIDAWLDICEREGTDGNEPVTAHTLLNYRYYAEFMNGYPWPCGLQDLSAPAIVEFRSWLLAHCPSRYTARKTLAYFHTVLGEMALRGHIPANPATGVSIRADSRYDVPIAIPTRRDVAALLSAADRLANSPNAQIARTWARYRPILYLAADAGMRPQEYLALAHSDLRDGGVQVCRAIEHGSRRISVTKTPAGRRFIDVSDGVLDMVRHYARVHGVKNAHDLVFPTANGKWQCPRNWRKRGFHAACLEAGLVEIVDLDGEMVAKPKYRPYDLRHFYASVLIEKKTNLKRLQKLMGHTNIETTLNTYGHLIDDMQIDSAENAGLLASLELACGEVVAEHS